MHTDAWPHVFVDGTGPVFLMLHGTGGDEHQISGLATALDPSAAILAPRGRVDENGAHRWFRRLGEGMFDVADVTARAGDLAGFVRWATDYYRLSGRELIAIGFSNGANIALALAALHPQVISRVIAFSGMYPFADEDLQTDLAGSHFTLLNGESDQMAPSASVARLAEQLTGAGAEVQLTWRPGGHGITEGDRARAMESL